MAVTAQDLDRTITIERLTETGRDAFNAPVYQWAAVRKERAKRRDASDGEKQGAGQVSSHLMTRFTVRSNLATRDLKPTDRLQHDGAQWNILGIKQADEGRNRFIEITAVRDAD